MIFLPSFRTRDLVWGRLILFLLSMLKHTRGFYSLYRPVSTSARSGIPFTVSNGGAEQCRPGRKRKRPWRFFLHFEHATSLGQTIPFPSQDAYGNTQGASIAFTALSRPQLGQANRSNSNITPSVDIQTIGNLSSGLPYGPPGMGYPVVSRNDAQQVEQQQQYVDMPSPPPFSFQDIFRGYKVSKEEAY